MTDNDQTLPGTGDGAMEPRNGSSSVGGPVCEPLQSAPASTEARFQAIFTSSRDAIGVSKAGVHVLVNPAYLELFGYPPGTSLAGVPVLDLIAPDSRDRIREYILRRVRGQPVPFAYETRGLRTDGSTFDMEVQVSLYQEGAEDHTLVILRDIAQRKMAEQEIAERGAMLEQIMDTASVAIFLVDKAGRIVHANRRMAEMFGCSLAELIHSEYVEHVHPSERETGRAKMLALLASEVPAVNLERLYWRPDGTEFWGHLAGRRFHDARGNELGLIGVITDISVRKQSISALEQSETKYRRLYNETPVLLHSIDREARLVDVNDYWFTVMGYERDEVLGRKVTQFFTPESRKYAEEVVQPAFFRDGSVKNIAYQFVRKNGEVVDVLLSATAERDAFGAIVRSLSVTTDITERKRMEDLLRQSEDRYRQLFEAESDAVFLIDNATGRLLMANHAAQVMYGYDRDELLAMKNTDLSAEPSMTRRVTEETPIVKENTVAIPLRYHRKKDGTVFAVEITGRFFEYEGRPVHLAAIRDITERRRLEAAQRENQAHLDLALQSAHMGVWRWEIKENRRYLDDQTCQLLGIDPTAFTGTGEEFLGAVHPEDRDMIKTALTRTLERDAPYEPTYRAVWPDGTVRHMAARARLVRDDQGQPERIHGVVWDVTDQQLLERERIKTKKLESIGTLAGGIAHDFNNLLQGVFGYISMAKLTHDQKEKSFAMLEQAEKALHRAVNLTAQLLTFSKGGRPVKRIIDLRPLVENTVTFAMSGSRNSYELTTDEGLPAVEADEGQLGQVVQNIVLNADQAMPLGGIIRVAIRNTPAATLIPPANLQGNLVEISIRDQGTGIPAEHLTRIFDPYFTTKEKGSGLGLTTSYSIVKNHGGLIRVESEVGRGSTFRIFLPASTVQGEEPKPPGARAPVRKGRILVMDDEAVVRTVACELLAAIGHETATAENGEAAVEAYLAARDAGRPFDAVILDLTIRGGLGGVETLRRLLEIDPGVKAVVSSGYSDDTALADYRAQGFRDFLKKPYDLEGLRDMLDSLLE